MGAFTFAVRTASVIILGKRLIITFPACSLLIAVQTAHGIVASVDAAVIVALFVH